MNLKKRFVLCLLAVLIIAAVAGYFWRERRGGPTAPTPDEMVKLLLEFDQNADGKLTTDEVPERMQGLFERGDANKDGVLSQEELRKLAEAVRRFPKHNAIRQIMTASSRAHLPTSPHRCGRANCMRRM